MKQVHETASKKEISIQKMDQDKDRIPQKT